MDRDVLSDKQWEKIEPLLPVSPFFDQSQGIRHANHPHFQQSQQDEDNESNAFRDDPPPSNLEALLNKGKNDGNGISN